MSPDRATSSYRRPGAGKTVFVGVQTGLGADDHFAFILMAEYEAPSFFHLDLYRLADVADAIAGLDSGRRRRR
jgi:tRNA A37 threonylcarbamoyladenosine biosynthesis protein TsaE